MKYEMLLVVCFFPQLFGALMFHLRTDAPSSLVTRRPSGMGSLGWTAAKWATMLYNQTVIVHLGHFSGRLVGELALVALHIRLQQIAHGYDAQELTTTTISLHVEHVCNGKRIVHLPRDPRKPQILADNSPASSGGQNQKWPTCGQGGYVTPAASGIPSASERGAKSEVAHLWARWLRNPCRLGDPHRFRAAGKIRSGTLVGKVAT